MEIDQAKVPANTERITHLYFACIIIDVPKNWRSTWLESVLSTKLTDSLKYMKLQSTIWDSNKTPAKVLRLTCHEYMIGDRCSPLYDSVFLNRRTFVLLRTA